MPAGAKGRIHHPKCAEDLGRVIYTPPLNQSVALSLLNIKVRRIVARRRLVVKAVAFPSRDNVDLVPGQVNLPQVDLCNLSLQATRGLISTTACHTRHKVDIIGDRLTKLEVHVAPLPDGDRGPPAAPALTHGAEVR